MMENAVCAISNVGFRWAFGIDPPDYRRDVWNMKSAISWINANTAWIIAGIDALVWHNVDA